MGELAQAARSASDTAHSVALELQCMRPPSFLKSILFFSIFHDRGSACQELSTQSRGVVVGHRRQVTEPLRTPKDTTTTLPTALPPPAACACSRAAPAYAAAPARSAKNRSSTIPARPSPISTASGNRRAPIAAPVP